MDLKKFQKLKEECDRLRRDIDRAEGALLQQEKRLKAEYGCSSLEEAEEELKKIKREIDSKEEEYEIELKKFEESWSKMLND